jgi:hypothetical protein
VDIVMSFLLSEMRRQLFLGARLHANLVFGLAGRSGVVFHAGSLLVAAHFAAIRLLCPS